MIKITKKTKREGQLNVEVEESTIRSVRSPDYILKMDKLFFKDGRKCVVTKADSNEIEIMIQNRVIVKKEDVHKFLKDLDHIERADCFDIN